MRITLTIDGKSLNFNSLQGLKMAVDAVCAMPNPEFLFDRDVAQQQRPETQNLESAGGNPDDKTTPQ